MEFHGEINALCRRPHNPGIDRIALELVSDVIKGNFNERQDCLVVALGDYIVTMGDQHWPNNEYENIPETFTQGAIDIPILPIVASRDCVHPLSTFWASSLLC
jgi:hypothetical protein